MLNPLNAAVREPAASWPPFQRAILILVTGAGITLQVIQREDSTPSYRYFTIWSTATLFVCSSGALARYPRIERLTRVSTSAGVVFSAVVYLAAIAPVNGLGELPLTIAANLMLHLVSPLVVIALFAKHLDWASTKGERRASLALPGAYLVWAEICSWLGTSPAYPFLDSTKIGLLGLLGVICGAGALFRLTAWLLSRIAGIWN